jgi:hypothetical protein
MDPISIGIMAVSIAGRVVSRSKIKKARAERNDAVQSERAVCISLCNRLAVDQQAAVGAHHTRIVDLTAFFGVQEEFFAKNGVFDGRTLAQVQGIVDRSQALFIPNPTIFGNAGTIATGAAVMLNGLELADRAGLASLPLLATSLHDVVAALPLGQAGGFADALGGLGLLDVGEVFGDALMVFSVFSTFRNLAKAKDVAQAASQYRSEAWALETKRAAMASKRQQISTSFNNLKTASYHLFTYTVVAQETAKLQRSSGKEPRTKPALPQWILDGLRRRAALLWATVQKSAFS